MTSLNSTETKDPKDSNVVLDSTDSIDSMVSMEIHGTLWNSMAFHGCHGLHGLHGFQESHGFHEFHGFHRFHGFHGFQESHEFHGFHGFQESHVDILAYMMNHVDRPPNKSEFVLNSFRFFYSRKSIHTVMLKFGKWWWI